MDFLQERDIQILKLMSNFNGKVYAEVLEKTLWHGYKVPLAQVRKRMQILTKKYNLFFLKPTGLMSPRNAYVLTENGKEIVRTLFDKNITSISLSPVTTKHNILEMISFYWLDKLGKEPIRTIVKNWSKENSHTPDLFYKKGEDKIYVEIETTIKNGGAYNNIFVNMIKDKVSKVLYILATEKEVERFARKLPMSDKVMLISIDNLIANASEKNKIGAFSQKTLLNNIK